MIERTDLEKCKQVVLSYLDIKPVVTKRDEKGKPLYVDHPLLHNLRGACYMDSDSFVPGNIEKKENWEKYKDYIRYKVAEITNVFDLIDMIEREYDWTFIYDVKDFISIFDINDILSSYCDCEYMKPVEKVDIIMKEFKHDVLHYKRLDGRKKADFLKHGKTDKFLHPVLYEDSCKRCFAKMNYMYIENILRNIDYVYRTDQSNEDSTEVVWYTDVASLLHHTYKIGHKQTVYKMKLDPGAVLFAWLGRGAVMMDLDYIRNTEKETFCVKQEDELWTPEKFKRSSK